MRQCLNSLMGVLACPGLVNNSLILVVLLL
jgi:hypothetical protein